MAKYKAPGVVSRPTSSQIKPDIIEIYFLSIQSPLNNSDFSISDNIVVSGTTNAPYGLPVVVKFGGSEYTVTVQNGGIWTVTIPTSNSLSHGTHTITATILDRKSKEISSSVDVFIDKIYPIITIDGGSERFSLDSIPTISGTVTDENMDFLSVEVSDGISVIESFMFTNTSITSNSWNVTLDSSLPDGKYVVSVSAEDTLGNNNTVIQNLIIDTTNPTTPSNLISFNVQQTSFSVSWSPSSDLGGVSYYCVYKDGVLFGTTTTTSYSFVGLTELTEYSIEISAVDEAGNESSLSSALVETTT